jgi:hypothetical protein
MARKPRGVHRLGEGGNLSCDLVTLSTGQAVPQHQQLTVSILAAQAKALLEELAGIDTLEIQVTVSDLLGKLLAARQPQIGPHLPFRGKVGGG